MSPERPSVAISSDNGMANSSVLGARSDRRLGAHEEPRLGAHLVTPRFAYAHHGIYVGSGNVVHYEAFAFHWHRGPVQEASLSSFAQGHPVWVRPARTDALPCEEIVRRARSRLGENRYRLWSNNCEHFSEWCVHGQHRSPQVERLLARLRCVSRAFGKLVRWLRRASPRRSGSTPLSMAWAFRMLFALSPRVTVRIAPPATSVAGSLFSLDGGAYAEYTRGISYRSFRQADAARSNPCLYLLCIPPAVGWSRRQAHGGTRDAHSPK